MKQQQLSEQKGKSVGRRLTQPSRGTILVTESPTLDEEVSPDALVRRGSRQRKMPLGTEVDEDWRDVEKGRAELEGGHQLSSVQSLVTLQGPCGIGMTASQMSGGVLNDADQADDFSLFKHGLQNLPQTPSQQQVFQPQDCFNKSESNKSSNDPEYQAIFSNQISRVNGENSQQIQDRNQIDSNVQIFDSRESQKQNLSQIFQPKDPQQNKDQMFLQRQINPSQGSNPKAKLVHQNLKTARMGVSDSDMNREFSSQVETQRISKSSTRQKRQTFSTTRNTKTVLVNQKSFKQAQQEVNQAQNQQADLMKSLQNKLRINLKKLQPSQGAPSGGESSSYSNKDLSERFQNLIKQRSALPQNAQNTSMNNQGVSWIKKGHQAMSEHSNMASNLYNQSSPNRQDSSKNGSVERTRSQIQNQIQLQQQLLHQSQGMQQQPSNNLISGVNQSQKPAQQQLPPNLSQDPVLYLQWRQQKHKSSRSDYPTHQSNYLFQQRKASPANAHTLRASKNGKDSKNKGPHNHNQGGDLNSSFSNSSQTTAIKSLSEVKNPSHLISFRFVNRDVTRLDDIERFRNLTELDLFGNRLQTEVPALLKLPFLKKLNLANNKISEVWRLPPTLEILNLSYNSLKKLDADIFRTLSNLTTFEVSNNGLESLEGLGQASRIKRIIAKNNQIQDLDPLKSLNMLVEVDLENNPIDQFEQLLTLLEEKSELLVLNIKMTPIFVKKQTFEQFMTELRQSDFQRQEKRADQFAQNLQFLHGGIFYRSRRVYLHVKQQLIQMNSKRSHSNFSNGSSSNENRTNLNSRLKGAFSPMQFSNSGNGQNRRADKAISDLSRSPLPLNEQESRLRGLSGSFNSNKYAPSSYGVTNQNMSNQLLLLNHCSQQQYEAIELLYDKLLEDEDKLMYIKRKKERKVRRQQRREQEDYKPHFDESMSSEEDDPDLDDLSDTLNDSFEDDSLLSGADDTFERDDFDLEEFDHRKESNGQRDRNDLKGDGSILSSQNELERELNASTADFNKEIKLINKQLQLEGKLPGPPRSDDSHRAANNVQQSASKNQQIRQQEQSVVQEVDESALISESQTSSARQQLLSQSQEASSIKSSAILSENQRQQSSKEPKESFESQEQKDGGANQIDAQEINVEVPREITSSRYTGRAHYKSARGNGANPIKDAMQQSQDQGSVVLRTDRNLPPKKTSQSSRNISESANSETQVNQQNFCSSQQAKVGGQQRVPQAKLKLDLRKVAGQENNTSLQSVVQKVSFGRVVDSQRAGRAGLSGQSPATKIQMVQISERIPIKKPFGNQKSSTIPVGLEQQKSDLDQSNANKAQLPPTAASGGQVQSLQKNILIPKLALANINKQQSEVSQNSTFATPVNLAKHQISEIQQNSKSGKNSQLIHKTDENSRQLSSLSKEKQNSKKVLRVLSKRGNTAQNATHDQFTHEMQQVEQGQLIVPTIRYKQIERAIQNNDDKSKDTLSFDELRQQYSQAEQILISIKRELGEESIANSHINRFIQKLKERLNENEKLFDQKLAKVNETHQFQLQEMQQKLLTLEKQKSCEICKLKKYPNFQIPTIIQASEPKIFNFSVPHPTSLYFFQRLTQQNKSYNMGQINAQNVEMSENFLDQTRISNFDSSLLSKINKLSDLGTPQGGDRGGNKSKRLSNSTRRGIKDSPARHARRNSQTIQLSSKQEMTNLDQKQQKLISPSNFNDSAYLMHTNAESRISEVLARSSQIQVKQRSRVRKSQAVSTETGQRQPRMQQQICEGNRQEKLNEGQTQVKVVQLLEKMRERNSSLQERLNNSFKSSTRVEEAAFANYPQRPSTALNQSFKNKGIKTERAYMSQQQQRNKNSQTPNMTINLNSQKVQMAAQGEIRGGKRPQIVKIPAHVLQNIVSAPTQENKYLDFLDSSTAQQKNCDDNSGEYTQMPMRYHKGSSEIVTLPIEDGESSNRVRLDLGIEKTEESPLFNFHKASAMLQNLSQTSRERVGSGNLTQNQNTRSNENFQVQNSYTNLYQTQTQTNNWVSSGAKPGTKTLKPSSASIVQKGNAPVNLTSNWRTSLQRSGSSEIISSALNSSAVVHKSNTFSLIKPPIQQQAVIIPDKPLQRTLGGPGMVGGSSTGRIPSQNSSVSAYWTTGIGAIFNTNNQNHHQQLLGTHHHHHQQNNKCSSQQLTNSKQFDLARKNNTSTSFQQNKIDLGFQSASTGSLQQASRNRTTIHNNSNHM